MIELNADRYHTGIRLTSLALWLAATVVVYMVVRWLVTLIFGPPAGLGVVLVAAVALFGAQPLAMLGEKQLLARWPSGRSVRLEGANLALREKSGATHLDLSRPINYWRWQFKIAGRRGGRVPNGHFCYALRLVQEETAVGVYAFLAPKAAEALAARYKFYSIRRPSAQDKLPLGGRDTLYLAAEQARWDSGAELEPADFETLLSHAAAHIPDFADEPNA